MSLPSETERRHTSAMLQSLAGILLILSAPTHAFLHPAGQSSVLRTGAQSLPSRAWIRDISSPLQLASNLRSTGLDRSVGLQHCPRRYCLQVAMQTQTIPRESLRSPSSRAAITEPESRQNTALEACLPALLSLALLFVSGTAANAVDSAQLPPGVIAKPVFEPRGITQQDLIVFAVCCFPFLWATVEFWRRIAVGEPFGTGKDSVVITDLPDSPAQRPAGDDKEGGRRTLTVGAIRVAYGLFAAVGGTVALVGVAAWQLISSGAGPH